MFLLNLLDGIMSVVVSSRSLESFVCLISRPHVQVLLKNIGRYRDGYEATAVKSVSCGNMYTLFNIHVPRAHK